VLRALSVRTSGDERWTAAAAAAARAAKRAISGGGATAPFATFH
jgi:hypothetical protein